MPNNHLYVWENGSHDLSRWLQISVRPGRVCVLHLSDLCQPGRLSSLTSVTCYLQDLEAAVTKSALQLTLGTGYFLLRRNEELVHIEFLGEGDSMPCRVDLLASEVLSRIEALANQQFATMA